ncbi:MAG: carboxypeptidase-like regulatory domain-containing protein [Candidatus Sulfotelmatobacter sp.]
MVTFSASSRAFVIFAVVGLLAMVPFAAAQTTTAPQATLPNADRVAGTVVSKTDGHPLARARVTLRDTKDSRKFESQVTAEDGKFEFHGVPPGKYSLTGAKRGFITAAYDQHDQFSTAIVTGAGIDTDALVLRLAPAAMISGKILDESGEPVRHASVTLYYRDHSSGVDEIHQSHGGQTDDQGEYEIPSLMPGTYFLSASAKPWYALHPQSEQPGARSRRKSQPDPTENFDRSLDVAYPVTYYSDVTETDSATAIPIRGGEHLQLDIHLNPVPSLHLLFHVPAPADHGYTIPQLEQPAFDGATFVQADSTRVISPGLVEISGVPAGRYNVLIREPGQPGVSVRMNGVDVARDHQEINSNSAEAVSSVKVSVKVPGATTLPDRLSIGLRSSARNFSGGKPVDAKGEVELPQMAPGRYEVMVWGPPQPYSIQQMSAEGATVSGHAVILPPGASATISLTLVAGSSNIEGTAKHAGKPFAGAMVVLVPTEVAKGVGQDPETSRDLFRRDQSDLDGTFSLRNVVPGSYILLAIENGWDLDWSQPAAIGPYLSHGQAIQVGPQVGRTMKIAEGVEVQSR